MAASLGAGELSQSLEAGGVAACVAVAAVFAYACDPVAAAAAAPAAGSLAAAREEKASGPPDTAGSSAASASAAEPDTPGNAEAAASSTAAAATLGGSALEPAAADEAVERRLVLRAHALVRGLVHSLRPETLEAVLRMGERSCGWLRSELARGLLHACAGDLQALGKLRAVLG
jgi:hypothetical protein